MYLETYVFIKYKALCSTQYWYFAQFIRNGVFNFSSRLTNWIIRRHENYFIFIWNDIINESTRYVAKWSSLRVLLIQWKKIACACTCLRSCSCGYSSGNIGTKNYPITLQSSTLLLRAVVSAVRYFAESIPCVCHFISISSHYISK